MIIGARSTVFLGTLLIAACSSSVPPSASLASPLVDGGLAEGGTTDAGISASARPYDVTVPTGYDATKPTPLVISLHGYGGSSQNQDAYMKLSALASAETFLLALPNGTADASGRRFWDATDACCNFFSSPVDDVAYLTGVIHDMKARYNVDPKRVYLIGHSNGGFMSHRLACALADEIAGFVSLAGLMMGDAANCAAAAPVAVLQVHGDADGTVSYDGGSFFGGGPVFPGAKESVAMWAAKNGCDPALTSTAETLDVDASLAGKETTVARHACVNGAAELWTIAGGSHIPRFTAAWASQIYGFLKAHPKP